MQLIFEGRFGAVESALMSAQRELRYYWAGNLATRPASRPTNEEAWKSGTAPMDLVCDEIVRRHLHTVREVCATVVSEDAGGGSEAGGTDAFLVDALDGTHNALAGYPMFTSSVALFENGEWAFAWVYDISRDVAYVAVKGEGSYIKTPLLSRRLYVNSNSEVGLAAISMMRAKEPQHRAQLERLFWHARKVRISSCSSIDLCLVAAGVLDAFVDIGRPGHERTCDIAAGALILAEAGGELLAPALEPRVLVPPSESALNDYAPLIAVSNRSLAESVVLCMSTPSMRQNNTLTEIIQ